MLHVFDPHSFRAFETGVAIVQAIHDLWPKQFAFRRKAYEFVADIPAFDLLCGSEGIRRGILAGRPISALRADWQPQATRFEAVRRRYLRYS
jgi:uncharacterized protein YbbC (DUF1343 family)